MRTFTDLIITNLINSNALRNEATWERLVDLLSALAMRMGQVTVDCASRADGPGVNFNRLRHTTEVMATIMDDAGNLLESITARDTDVATRFRGYTAAFDADMGERKRYNANSVALSHILRMAMGFTSAQTDLAANVGEVGDFSRALTDDVFLGKCAPTSKRRNAIIEVGYRSAAEAFKNAGGDRQGRRYAGLLVGATWALEEAYEAKDALAEYAGALNREHETGVRDDRALANSAAMILDAVYDALGVWALFQLAVEPGDDLTCVHFVDFRMADLFLENEAVFQTAVRPRVASDIQSEWASNVIAGIATMTLTGTRNRAAMMLHGLHVLTSYDGIGEVEYVLGSLADLSTVIEEGLVGEGDTPVIKAEELAGRIAAKTGSLAPARNRKVFGAGFTPKGGKGRLLN